MKKKKVPSKTVHQRNVKKLIFIIILAVVTALFIMSLSAKKAITPSKSTLVYADQTFSGVLPCADCSGLKTTITFNSDGTYKEEDIYEGKSVKPLVIEGTYSINQGMKDNASAVIYELSPKNEQKQYYVLEDDDMLTLLDSDKARIDSPFNQSLKKQ